MSLARERQRRSRRADGEQNANAMLHHNLFLLFERRCKAPPSTAEEHSVNSK
jgi:hypothetical protein